MDLYPVTKQLNSIDLSHGRYIDFYTYYFVRFAFLIETELDFKRKEINDLR